jgi:ferrochelatase
MDTEGIIQMTQTRIGLLVAQLGTPAAPTPKAVRHFLREFLSDERVIDYPRWFWKPILHGIILRTRPKRSAALYQRIWREDGSPLMVYSQKQVSGLQARLGDNFRVLLGMTYGEPNIATALQQFESEGIDRIIVLPMYPQYASTTTASVIDKVNQIIKGSRHKRTMPTLRIVPPYYSDEGYIAALAENLATQVAQWGKQADQYIFTFHGNPLRYTRDGDPYQQQCEVTAQRLADALNLQDHQWRLTFQSRFGPEAWLQPYTDETLENLAREGVQNVVIYPPGFTADCLETLDELGNEGLEQWETGGGHADGYFVAACLNDNPVWLDALADIVHREAQGWVETVTQTPLIVS